MDLIPRFKTSKVRAFARTKIGKAVFSCLIIAVIVVIAIQFSDHYVDATDNAIRERNKSSNSMSMSGDGVSKSTNRTSRSAASRHGEIWPRLKPNLKTISSFAASRYAPIKDINSIATENMSDQRATDHTTSTTLSRKVLPKVSGVRKAAYNLAIKRLKNSLNVSNKDSVQATEAKDKENWNNLIKSRELTESSLYSSHKNFLKKVKKQIYARTATRVAIMDHDTTPFKRIGIPRYEPEYHGTNSISEFNTRVTSILPQDVPFRPYMQFVTPTLKGNTNGTKEPTRLHADP